MVLEQILVIYVTAIKCGKAYAVCLQPIIVYAFESPCIAKGHLSQLGLMGQQSTIDWVAFTTCISHSSGEQP